MMPTLALLLVTYAVGFHVGHHCGFHQRDDDLKENPRVVEATEGVVQTFYGGLNVEIVCEEWRPVAGSNGYEVSNLGNARTVDRVIIDKNGAARRLRGTALVPCPCGNGYRQIHVHGKSRLLHILVAEAFIGPRGAGRVEVNHKNTDKTDNRADNLEYTTSAGNKDHAKQHGLFAVGERQGGSVLTEDQVMEISRRLACESPTSLAVEFGVSVGAVFDIKKRKNWHHLPLVEHAIKHSGPHKSNEAIEAAVQMKLCGASFSEVRAATGVGQTTITRRIKAMGKVCTA